MNYEMARLLDTFSAREACELTGTTATMLDYLTREGYVAPSGSGRGGRGRRRIFVYGDLVVLKVLAKLLRSGVELRRLKRGLRLLRKRLGSPADLRSKVRFIISDGVDVYFLEDGKLESLAAERQLSFMFLIDVAACHRELATATAASLARSPRAVG